MAEPTRKRKLFTWVTIGGILVLMLAGTVTASIYFKLLPFEFSSNFPFVSRIDSTNSIKVPNDNQQQAVNQSPVTNNTAAVPANTQDTVAISPVTSTATNATLINNQDQNKKNITKVSQVYSSMKPEEAVAILNNFDVKAVSDILQKMDEDQAAKILAAMDPKRASAISRELLQYRSISNPKTN